jgi:hypothetical protein
MKLARKLNAAAVAAETVVVVAVTVVATAVVAAAAEIVVAAAAVAAVATRHGVWDRSSIRTRLITRTFDLGFLVILRVLRS